MEKRVAFQQMLTRVRTADDVDCILVYKLSRMARNRIDDALVMADLRRPGITLISATEAVLDLGSFVAAPEDRDLLSEDCRFILDAAGIGDDEARVVEEESQRAIRV